MVKITISDIREMTIPTGPGTFAKFKLVQYSTDDNRVGTVRILAEEFTPEKATEVIQADLAKAPPEGVGLEFELEPEP